jgi:hypothetical protein
MDSPNSNLTVNPADQTAGHTDALQPSAPVAASVPPAPQASGQFDLNAIIAEVEALAKIAGVATAPVASTPMESSVAALEREVEALMKSATSTAPSISNADVVTEQPVSIAESSLRIETCDPMLLELSGILDDTNESIINNAGGDLDSALRVVFDARALSGQDEDVNAALIEAFGTTRRVDAWRTTKLPTNPAPKFEGVAREIPSNVPRDEYGPTSASTPASSTGPIRTFEEIGVRAAANEAAAEYAGETPFEPAFPVVSINDAPTVVVSATAANNAALASSTPALVTTTAVTPRPTHIVMLGALLKRGSRSVLALLLKLTALPLQLCALPMRFLPETAKQITTVAALSMVVVVPAAWWLAHNSAVTPGIGRVEFPKPAEAKAETAVEAGAAHAGPAHASPPSH